MGMARQLQLEARTLSRVGTAWLVGEQHTHCRVGRSARDGGLRVAAVRRVEKVRAAAKTTPTAAKRAAPAGAKKPVAKKAALKPVSLPAPPAKVKHKLVRDSFTIPKSEYALLDALKARAANLKRPVKKSELLRAGISALNTMSDKAFLQALGSVPSLKTGRPSKASAE